MATKEYAVQARVNVRETPKGCIRFALGEQTITRVGGGGNMRWGDESYYPTALWEFPMQNGGSAVVNPRDAFMDVLEVTQWGSSDDPLDAIDPTEPLTTRRI